jgi:hypothetical protein
VKFKGGRNRGWASVARLNFGEGGMNDVLDFPLKCTPRLRARANYIQNRENSLLLKFNNYISNKDINFLS